MQPQKNSTVPSNKVSMDFEAAISQHIVDVINFQDLSMFSDYELAINQTLELGQPNEAELS